MKLHIPVLLRKALLACFAVCSAYTMGLVASAADLTLGKEDSLTIDYADIASIPDLENGTLQLNGDTLLLLSNCGVGDGKTYTLLTGVSALLDAEGNAIVLDSSNNAISHYFDTTQPGVGFWTDATLALTDDGTLQLVRHQETVKAAQTITTRQTQSLVYSYYAGISFEDITQSSSSHAYGGAIRGSTIELSGNGSVTFSGNTASGPSSSYDAYGGAIYGGSNSTIELSGNGSVEFSGNTASASYAYGGAIYGESNSTIELSGNGSVTFIGNTACHGGAIRGSTIELSGNGSVTFSGNTSSDDGGAIHVIAEGTIRLSGNGSVTFSGNTSSYYGGAIYGYDGSTIELIGNGNVTFSGNTASSGYGAYGGAIRGYGNLSIRNNDSVLFEKNAEKSGSSYRLRSIYAGGSGDVISLSAAAGKSIEFRDSVYIDSYSTVNLNADYTDADGLIHKQTGDIIFTGKYTEQHLNELLAADGLSRTATAEEILSSRTTEVYAMTNLYGGRLRVEDGAVYEGFGITAHEGSAATVLVKDATLNHVGYDLVFNADTTLELAGNNSISGDVRMLENSTLLLNIGESAGCTDIIGNLDIVGGLTLSNTGTQPIENGLLMYVAGTLNGWTENTWMGNSTNDRVTWLGNLLVLNYNEATFNRYFNGTANYSTAQNVNTLWHHYQTLTFEYSSAAASYGGAIYGESDSTIALSENESVTFSDNTASASVSDYEGYAKGGAIYGDTIELSGNESVTFSDNTASSSSDAYGGAIYGSTIELGSNGSVEFSGNTARYGGAIVGDTITLSGNESVMFRGNRASSFEHSYGGAIYGASYGTIMLSGNGSVTFSGNTASYYGGAIYGDYHSTITLRDNESVTFSGNTASGSSSSYDAYAHGGAIYGDSYGTIMLSGNGSVTFSGNSGGAIYGASYGTIMLSGNGSVTFSGNSGGAIYRDWGSTIELSGNGSVTFSGNSGGAIYGYGSTIELSGNDSVTFSGNRDSSGGAIYGDTIELSGNGSVTFSENTGSSSSSDAYGGAIYGGSNSTIELSGNESVEFSGNMASSSDAYGGAIYGGSNSTIELSGNGSVEFIGNTASFGGKGGAIYGYSNSTITLSGNGSVTFSGNTASSSGGAIYGDGDITLSGNGSVTFSGNRASYDGGAILGYGNLSIRNNDSVLFEKNAEVEYGTYRLRSIYAGGSGGVISLSAAAGKSIEFRDSVYIASDSTVNLNADYTDANGVVHKQTGDIIFTGAYTEQHLNELLAADGLSRTATAGEILNSRTTAVYAMTNLYGGRLRVEDGTVYKGYGITAHEGSAATVLVKDATLNHAKYDLVFHSGTTLELVGDNVISGNVRMHAGSTLTFDMTDDPGYTTHSGGLSIDDDTSIRILLKPETWDEERGALKTIILLESDDASLSGVTYANTMATVSGLWVYKNAEWSDGQLKVLCKNGAVNATWTNESGDGRWNHTSLNWVDDGFRFADVDGANIILGAEAAGNILLEEEIAIGNMTVRGNSSYALEYGAGAGLMMSGDLQLETGSSLTIGGGIVAASVLNDGALEVAGNLEVQQSVRGDGVLKVDASLSSAGLLLTDEKATHSIGGAVTVGGVVEIAGSLSASSLELTAADAANSVVGDLTADAVSLASGASLEVGGTLTAAEVLIHGPAKVLQAGAFGAETMNFVLDRAALESLNLSYEETGTIARANTAMGSGFAATLNGGTMPVQAAAYVYDISVNGGAVQLTADYAHDGLQVWYRSGWVGQSDWTDFYIAGYDAVNGVETVDLGGGTVQGANLFIAYEDDVRSSVVKNGELEFEYVDMGGGQFELGENATMTTDELYGKGETLVMHRDSVLNATELTLGTLALEGGELTVKKATINAMSGTEGTLNIERNGRVTVKSDVTLTGLENLGSLNLGKNTLTVNALVDVGGDVTAGEVAVQSRGSRMASFDKLVADKVTVVNNISAGRYTDDLSVGDGSSIGELVAEMLEVREGVVTLGRTDAATEQVLKALDLQEDAALVLNQQTSLSVTDELSATEGAELRLKQQASVSYGDMSIRNRGAATQVVVNAYDLANDSIQELSHAHVAVSGDEDRSIDYKLTNSSVENTGSGKLYLTHAENTFSSISAGTGDIAVMNQALELNLDELVVGEGVSFSAYRGEVELPEQEAVVSVSQSVSFGAGAHINADLKLQSGVRVEMNGPVSMGSDLYLFSGMTLGGAMLETLTSTEQGQTVVLFSGIDRLYLSGEEQTDAIALSHGISASEYFVNLISSQERSYYLVYDNELPGEGVLSIAVSGLAVPEPTSSMLGLMGLVAFTLRRRRK